MRARAGSARSSAVALVVISAATAASAETGAPPPRSAGAADLPAIAVKNRNTNVEARIRLYDPADGSLDRAALRTFMRVASSNADLPEGSAPDPLDPRLVQLAVRAAYHFKSTSMLIVSATRRGDHGKHGKGEALDFRLGNVRAAALAAYARGFPRAGIGLYDHPETQYLHIDVRPRSWQWSDGSPPGGALSEKVIADPTYEQRDASWTPATDLPEAATAH